LSAADHAAKEQMAFAGGQPIANLRVKSLGKTFRWDAENTASRGSPLDNLASFVEPKTAKVTGTPINRNQILFSKIFVN
jgi:hypothetical protein